MLTVEEAAAMAGVKPTTIIDWIHQHKLRYRLFSYGPKGLRKRIDTVDLIEWLNKLYPYPEMLNPDRWDHRKYLKRNEDLRKARIVQARLRAERKSATQQTSQLPNKQTISGPAAPASSPADQSPPPEDQSGADQAAEQSTRTDDTPASRDISSQR
jgi:excisionase family DNA binding protein